MNKENENVDLKSHQDTGKREKSDEQTLIDGLRFQRKANINMVRIFFILWISVSLIALIPTLRPTFSQTEKRELHKFPKFTFSSLISGNYFYDIGLWYSDTFPFRDSFVNINSKIKSTFGINDIEVHGEVVAVNTVPDNEENAKESAPEGTDNIPDNSAISTEESQEVVTEKIGAMAIIGNSGYEYYNFDKGVTDAYISSINRAADVLAGKARVFDTVVPTSIAITLDDSISSKISSSDQKAAIDYIYSNISGGAICVDTYSILKQHKDEYLYFRTDHHWTALAAHYSYSRLMAAAGKPAAELSNFREYVFEGFLGTFYSASKMSPKLKTSPDTVYAYEPPGLEYIHTYEKGYEKDYHIVSDANNLTSSQKYLTFVCGDHPLGVITNNNIADNSACLIVKESFGNAMVAFLTQNYHTVYVADYRTVKSVHGGNLETFVSEHGVNDVFFVNNISATRSIQLVNLMSDFIG